MLTADLVDARSKDGELVLRRVDEATRAEAQSIAEQYLEAARGLVGCRREEVEEAFAAVGESAKGRKLVLGLRKLALDACVFEGDAEVDPVAIRRALFTRASEVRRSRESGEPFSRADVVADVAASLDLAPEALERGLFADLRGEQVLRGAPRMTASSLVEAWELGRAQAVLLTAVRVTCEIAAASPGALRAFFARLKFHGLLFAAERSGSGFRVVIDGPYSMFEATTRYGLRLALLLPALRELEHWSLVAEVRWGKARTPLTFRLASDRKSAPIDAGEASPSLHLGGEAQALLEGVEAIAGVWRARPAGAILDVPGAGVCIPDLELRRRDEGAGDRERTVYVEVLGFWSRAAVFRRIELAERGLDAAVVFVLGARLRVSAELLDEELPASLYVFKTRPNARTLLEHVERVARAATATRPAR